MTIVIGTVSTAFAPILHAVNPALAIVVQTLVAAATMAAVPSCAPAIAVYILLFQNVFVSILSPWIANPSELEFIKGYNFLNCSVMWLIALGRYATQRHAYGPVVNRLMLGSTFVLAVVGIYFLMGLQRDPLAASIYLRNIVLPIFLFQLSLLSASTQAIRLTRTVVAIGVIFIVCGYVELLARDFWLHITNGYAYWQFDEIKATASGVWEREMRATGRVIASLKDRFTFGFLNTPLLDGLGLSEVMRIFGPNISAISYAYGVAFFILFLTSAGRPLLAAAALPLVVMCGVKGALITLVFVGVAWLATRLIGASITFALALAGLAGYVAFGIQLGLRIGDYHVLGFMGGLNGFLASPLGRSLGDGGNLAGDFASIDWSAAQQSGAVDGAVESAVGVLLYQMGVAALVPLGFYFLAAFKSWQYYARSGLLMQGFAAYGTLVVLVNGIFQEEALFAPPALGLMMWLTGLVIGNAARAEVPYEFASIPEGRLDAAAVAASADRSAAYDSPMSR
ncbi:MAG: hypothetical protein HZA66_26315 [Rhodopseudomonas palustris]|uniref:Uncharacterized protein n=1 Tax=Rhodopseudomonas palustris TaxID=1076 RepID=A0A933S3A2_RHOPL|nr:hypothetical protein [Rhodopseudomonas palustris]